MSQRIYYEIDGHVRGPISLTQLQLMATSGMLLPQHRLRREDTEEWFLAQSVRGLFSDVTPAVPVGGVVAEVVPTPGEAADESPLAGYAPGESPPEPEFNAAFDFFSESEPAPATAPGAIPTSPSSCRKRRPLNNRPPPRRSRLPSNEPTLNRRQR